MLICFIIWCCLILFSLASGLHHAKGHQFKLILHELTPPGCSYNFGLSYKQYDAFNPNNKEHFRIDTLTIGFVLLTIEIDFFKQDEVS